METWFLVLITMGIGGTSQTIPAPFPTEIECAAAASQSVRVAPGKRKWTLTEDVAAFCVKGPSR